MIEKMMQTAKALLEGSTDGEYTQAIVLLSKKGTENGAIIANALDPALTDEKALIARIVGDTEISYILCVWQNGGIDLPSITFRRMLVELDVRNLGAKIFLRTENGYSEKELGMTI